MAARNLPASPRAFISIDPLRIDAAKLKKARRILDSVSDVDTVNRALAMLIANEEMESAIEKAFGSVPHFQAP